MGVKERNFKPRNLEERITILEENGGGGGGGSYVLPTATKTRLGGVKVGNGLNVDASGVLSTEVTQEDLNTLGEIVEEKYGPDNAPPYPVTSVNGKTGDVVIPGSEPYVLPKATADVLGGVTIGDGINVNDGKISAEVTVDELNSKYGPDNAPPYPVTSVNGKTGDVVLQSGKQMCFTVTEDMVTVTTDPKKGVAPWSTSYGMTYIEIDKDSGVEWIEGALYSFIVNTEMVVSSTYRNVAIRIGGDEDGDVWHPFMNSSGSIGSGNSIFIKDFTGILIYKSIYITYGGLHTYTDTNTTYPYLVNTVLSDSTDSPVTIDSDGYGAKFSLIFPTTPLNDSIDDNERWSSPMLSSSSSTSKKAFTKKLYLDRTPLYIYTDSIVAGGKAVNALYLAYTGASLFNHLANTGASYITARRRVYMYLKDFNITDMSFYADATVGNVMSEDNISKRFPATVEGDVYLLYLGWNQATYSEWQPDFTRGYVIYKYSPSTGDFVEVGPIGKIGGSSYELPIASNSRLGGIKVGANLQIDSNGVLSATGEFDLPTASPTTLGGIKCNGTSSRSSSNGLYIDDGTLKMNVATNGGLGTVAGGASNKEHTFTINEDGTIRPNNMSLRSVRNLEDIGTFSNMRGLIGKALTTLGRAFYESPYTSGTNLAFCPIVEPIHFRGYVGETGYYINGLGQINSLGSEDTSVVATISIMGTSTETHDYRHGVASARLSGWYDGDKTVINTSLLIDQSLLS